MTGGDMQVRVPVVASGQGMIGMPRPRPVTAWGGAGALRSPSFPKQQAATAATRDRDLRQVPRNVERTIGPEGRD